jgi:hypothetical protein
MLEFAAIEQGAILQNLRLMTEALGRGGFAHFAAYPGIWCEVLGFRMASLPFSRTIGTGAFRDGGAATAWREPARVQAGIPPYSDRNVAAAVAVCEYAHRRYGRIPPGTGPFRTLLAFQAHRLDAEFYGAFYADR